MLYVTPNYSTEDASIKFCDEISTKPDVVSFIIHEMKYTLNSYLITPS